MEIEEIKTTWEDLSKQLADQKKLTRDIILKMTNEKTKSRLGKLVNLSSLAYYGNPIIIIWIIYNFDRLASWPIHMGAIVAIIILLSDIIFNHQFVRSAKKVDVNGSTYKEVLLSFKKCQLIYRRNLRLMPVMGTLIVLALWPVVIQIKAGHDPFQNMKFLLISELILLVVVAMLVVPLFIWMNKQMRAVKEMIEDLDE